MQESSRGWGREAFAAALCVWVGTALWCADSLCKDIACVLELTQTMPFFAQDPVFFHWGTLGCTLTYDASNCRQAIISFILIYSFQYKQT